jgi:hypothetical protein
MFDAPTVLHGVKSRFAGARFSTKERAVEWIRNHHLSRRIVESPERQGNGRKKGRRAGLMRLPARFVIPARRGNPFGLVSDMWNYHPREGNWCDARSGSQDFFAAMAGSPYRTDVPVIAAY